MLRRLFGGEPPWQSAYNTAEQAARLLMNAVREGQEQGMVTDAQLPLYQGLILGSVALFREMVSGRVYHAVLQDVRFAGRTEAAAYVLVIVQRL